MNVTEKLNLAAGLRFSDDEKDFEVDRPIGPFGAPAAGPFFRNVGDEQISFDLSATYAVTDDTNLYARVSRGFRAPPFRGVFSLRTFHQISME